MTNRLRRGLLFACLFLIGSVFAQSVEIRLGSPREGGVVAPHSIAGFNIGNAMRVVGFENEFHALNVDTLRFPPGNQADEIEVGAPDLRALAANVELLGGARLMLVANLFSGTSEQAARMARLAQEIGLDVFAWEIGNEPDLYATNRNDPSWTPEKYCSAFREFRDSLLEVDPSYQFAGPGVSGGRPAGEEYLHAVLKLCGDAIDILSWHIYPTDGTQDDASALGTAAQFSEEFARLREAAASQVTNPLGFERDYLFAVTEFGLSWRSASFRHLEDMTAAVWLADVLGRMASEGLDYSHYFALQAMGGHGLIDIGGWVRPTYHVFEMLADFAGVPLTVEVSGSKRAALVTAYATRRESGTRLLVVNRNLREVAVRMEAVSSTGASGQLRLLDQVSFDETGVPAVHAFDSGSTFVLPARSLAVATFSLERESDD